MTATTHDDGCANCRRPLHWAGPDIGWLHGELPQHAHEALSCARPVPGCIYRTCDHTTAGPDPTCSCRCHVRA